MLETPFLQIRANLAIIASQITVIYQSCLIKCERSSEYHAKPNEQNHYHFLHNSYS